MTRKTICGPWIGLAVIAIAMPSVAHAGTDSYACEVKQALSLSEKDGMLSPESSAIQNVVIGSKFSVSRITGQVIGETVGTETASSTKVLERGSIKNSFRSIADWADPNLATHAFQLLEIEEFVKGPDKPFLVFSSGGVGLRSGFCR
jgi:hypothetical protein